MHLRRKTNFVSLDLLFRTKGTKIRDKTHPLPLKGFVEAIVDKNSRRQASFGKVNAFLKGKSVNIKINYCPLKLLKGCIKIKFINELLMFKTVSIKKKSASEEIKTPAV